MRAVGWAIVAAVGLVAVYLVLGGASYAPAKLADPCAARDWTEPDGLEEVAGQIVLSALDGVACELGVSREEVVLAFESRDSLDRFARTQGISDDEPERLVRAGLERAIVDAERADALSPRFAAVLRSVVERIPLERLIGLLDTLLS